MDAPDEVIHQPIRLRVMAALTALGPEEEGLDFTRLKDLGAHIDHLTRAGYVEVAKAFVARRPRTTVKASPAGRAAFARHVAFLKAIIAGG
jgi:DNA-binding MarR family transcriptional regulator